ncbi:hypothetical protein F3J34_26095 [Klebsiella sp. Ap-873]|nr:hypothetical protein [Klebsiella sp. Ap-873]
MLLRVLSRIKIATLDLKLVEKYNDQCLKAIDYWIEKRTLGNEKQRRFSISKIRVFVEFLARLTTRANSQQAQKNYLLAINFGKNSVFHHHWLYAPLNNLLTYSIEAMGDHERNETLLETLLFPLASEFNCQIKSEWPNPEPSPTVDRCTNISIDNRIDELINRLEFNSTDNNLSLTRLYPLIKKNYLTIKEQNKIADKIWGGKPDYLSIPETGFYKYTLLIIPCIDKEKSSVIVQNHLFESPKEKLYNEELLLDIVNSALSKTSFPNEKQAIEYFRYLTDWRFNKTKDESTDWEYEHDKGMAAIIGDVLSLSVIPNINKNHFTEENYNRLHDFYCTTHTPETIIAFPYFAFMDHKFSERVSKIIINGLNSPDNNNILHASFAILVWRERSASSIIKSLVNRLISSITANKIDDSNHLLWTANELLKKDLLFKNQIKSLIDALPMIYDSYDYKNIENNSLKALNFSLIREQCVILAKNIVSKNNTHLPELTQILESARTDPLPEVRHAGLID